MAYKDGVLTINEWPKGMANAPYTGISNISNCEVFNTPGVLQIANSTVSDISSTLTGMPIAYIKDSQGGSYYLTDDAKFYKNDTLLSDLGSFGWDLCLYGDYVVASYSSGGNGKLAVYGPISNGPTLFDGWSQTGSVSGAAALSGTYYLKLIPARNGDLIITNGESMAKITNFIAGAPSVAPTATLSVSSMLLPSNNAAVTAVEIGIYIAIGTQAKNGGYYARDNGLNANIYLWDKEDTKPTTLASSLNETSIQAMFSSNNRIYLVAGIQGNVYITDTNTFTKIKRIPWNQNQLFSATTETFPNAMSLNINGNLLIGTSSYTAAYGSDPSNVRHGVWEISLSEGYPIVFKQQISTGNLGQSSPLYIGFVNVYGSQTLIGWRDGSSYGLDTTDFPLYTSHVAMFESPYYVIATRNIRKTFKRLEFLLGRPFITGQEIKLYYRKNLTDDYTLWKTYNYTTLGAVISHDEGATLADVQAVQFKVTLTQPTSAVFGSNIDLLSITLV